LLKNFRARLIQYRSARINQEVSIHINAMEIALCLSEYAHLNSRKIKNDEMKWFEAGLQLEYVLAGSEWEDLLDYYDKLQSEVKTNHLVETK
jgi:hypothetical protein